MSEQVLKPPMNTFKRKRKERNRLVTHIKNTQKRQKSSLQTTNVKQFLIFIILQYKQYSTTVHMDKYRNKCKMLKMCKIIIIQKYNSLNAFQKYTAHNNT